MIGAAVTFAPSFPPCHHHHQHNNSDNSDNSDKVPSSGRRSVWSNRPDASISLPISPSVTCRLIGRPSLTSDMQSVIDVDSHAPSQRAGDTANHHVGNSSAVIYYDAKKFDIFTTNLSTNVINSVHTVSGGGGGKKLNKIK